MFLFIWLPPFFFPSNMEKKRVVPSFTPCKQINTMKENYSPFPFLFLFSSLLSSLGFAKHNVKIWVVSFLFFFLGKYLNPKYFRWKYQKISCKLQSFASFPNSNRTELHLVAELAFCYCLGQLFSKLFKFEKPRK